MRTRWLRRALVACALMAPTASATAAQDALLRAAVDTTLVTVGDRITLTLTVEHAPGTAVLWPDSLDVSPFEVLAARAAPPETEQGRTTSRAAFALTTFELGAHEIPSFDLAVRFPDGSEQTLSTDRFVIEVVSVGVDEGGDIREIRGPLSIPMSALRIALWVLALLLLFAGAYALGQRLRRRAPDEDAPVEPSRPPHELALDALARLEASAMLDRGAIKEFHIEVSEILRRYVEARYHVAALEMTTGEVLEGLRRVGVGADFRDDLSRFLDRCDLVKFAKVRPGVDASREVLALGRRLVEASVEQLEEVG